MPLAWAFLGVVSIAGGFYVAASRVRRSYATFGKSSALGIEASAALIAIPLSGLVASVGSSYAFYQLSRPGADDAGWYTLAESIGVALVIIVAFVWVIGRHQSGANPLPFDPDVDARLGIRELRRQRTSWDGTSFFVGEARFAAERANEAVQAGADEDQPTLRDAIASVMRDPHDRVALLVVSLAGVPWVTAIFLTGGKWWQMLALCGASLVLLLVAGGVGGLTAYYEQLRWARRESELHEKLRLRRKAREQHLDGAELVRRIDALGDEMRAMRGLLENPGGGKAPGAWLSAMTRKARVKPRSRRRQRRR